MVGTVEAKRPVDSCGTSPEAHPPYIGMDFHEKSRQALRELVVSKDEDLPNIEFIEPDEPES